MLWIQVKVLYNESIPLVLIEGLEKFTQEQKDKLSMTSCQRFHPPQPDPESATASSLLLATFLVPLNSMKQVDLSSSYAMYHNYELIRLKS